MIIYVRLAAIILGVFLLILVLLLLALRKRIQIAVALIKEGSRYVRSKIDNKEHLEKFSLGLRHLHGQKRATCSKSVKSRNYFILFYFI